MTALRKAAEATALTLLAGVIALGLADYLTGAATLADWFWGVK